MPTGSATAPALARVVAVTAAEQLTGRIALGGGRASLYFFLGKPVHATCLVDGTEVAGEPAVDAIVGTYRGADLAFDSADVPAYTLDCTVEELVNRLNTAEGEATTPPAPRGPALGDQHHVPLLPRGRPLFDSIPLGAIVLEALSPALANGAIIAQREGSFGVVLVRDGAIFESYCFNGAERLLGTAAMARIRTMAGATVSAYQFSAEVVDLAPVLLRGEAVYEDLHLEWVEWEKLLDDLGKRTGTFVVEVETPAGSGVTCFHDGRHVGTYTDTHPDLGELALLDGVIASGHGVIWVRRHGQALAELEEEQAAPGSAAPASPTVEVAGSSPTVEATTAPEAAAPGSPTEPNPDGASLDSLVPELKSIARARLQRQSARLESLLDDAVQQQKPAIAAIEDLRSVVIRGVMQNSLNEVVDEMLTVVRRQGQS